jgi:hypothetical protein
MVNRRGVCQAIAARPRGKSAVGRKGVPVVRGSVDYLFTKQTLAEAHGNSSNAPQAVGNAAQVNDPAELRGLSAIR